MATIADLETVGHLLAYDPDFEADEFPSRRIYCDPAFNHWQETVLINEAVPAIGAAALSFAYWAKYIML
jgi:hypothetical protein